jgi:dolichol kinase
LLLVQLSVGVMDSLAATCGQTFGRHRWFTSNKTLEGTFGAICGTLLLIFAMKLEDNCGTPATLVAVVAVGLLEAFTSQIDNLVLPVSLSISILLWC